MRVTEWAARPASAIARSTSRRTDLYRCAMAEASSPRAREIMLAAIALAGQSGKSVDRAK